MQQHLLYIERKLNEANSRIAFLEFLLVVMFIAFCIIFVCVYPTYCEYRELAEKIARIEEYQVLSSGYVGNNYGLFAGLEDFVFAVLKSLSDLFGG